MAEVWPYFKQSYEDIKCFLLSSPECFTESFHCRYFSGNIDLGGMRD